MSRRRLIRVALVVALLAGAHGVSVAPAQAADEMRAVDCCARHCGKHTLPMGAARCCAVERTDSVATLSAAKDRTAKTPQVATAVLVSPTPAGASPVAAVAPRGSGSRAGPLFLTLRSLRL